jgi:hypothetical protein
VETNLHIATFERTQSGNIASFTRPQSGAIAIFRSTQSGIITSFSAPYSMSFPVSFDLWREKKKSTNEFLPSLQCRGDQNISYMKKMSDHGPFNKFMKAIESN